MELILKVAVIATGSGVIAAHIWATKHHFHSDNLPTGALAIAIAVLGSWAFFALFIAANGQPDSSLAAGLFLQILSAALFVWTVTTTKSARLRYAFDPGAPHRLIVEGPYRLVRHPFYASYILLWVGWAVASASPWGFLPVLLFVLLYVRAASQEEALFRSSPLAKSYRAYSEATGFLLPKILPIKT